MSTQLETASEDFLAPPKPSSTGNTSWQRPVLGGGFIFLFLLTWELFSRQGLIDVKFGSAPTLVVVALARLLSDPGFWEHLQSTATGFFIGWGASVIAAVSLGVAMGWYRLLRDTLEPFFSAVYAIPRSALIPLLLIWFGFGLSYKVAIVAMLAFFPLLISTIAGIRGTDITLIRMAQSFGANDRQLLWAVALPAAVPFILTGMRQSAALGMVSIIVGELFSSSSGLGYLISTAAQTFQTDRVFAVLVVLSVLGLSLNESLPWIESRLVRWQHRR